MLLSYDLLLNFTVYYKSNQEQESIVKKINVKNEISCR